MNESAPASIPPPIPAEAASTIHHKAAKFAVTVLVVAFLTNLSVQLGQSPTSSAMAPVSRVISVLGGLLFLSAIPAGVIALLGIKKHGCRYLLWRGLVGVLVPVLLTAMAIPAFLRVREASSMKTFENIAAAINKETPKMIDEMTRLDKATVGPGPLLTIDVTIVSHKAAEIDLQHWNTEAKATLKTSILASPIAQELRKGSTLTYRYFGADGIKIDEISVTSADLPAQKSSTP